MNDPDAITLLMWLAIIGTPAAVYLLVEHFLPKRNRRTRSGWRATRNEPFDDDRCSIRNFKRMHMR